MSGHETEVSGRHSPRPPWEENPYGLVNLADLMATFRATDSQRMMDDIRQFGAWAPRDRTDTEMRHLAISGLRSLISRFDALAMRVSAQHARRALNDIELFGVEHYDLVEIGKRAAELETTANNELSATHFVLLRADRSGLYDDGFPFGHAVHERLHSLRYEISEATKCFALERPTATVAHLMRCSELAARILARSLGVKKRELETLTMDKTIRKLRDAVETRMKLGHQGKTAKWTADNAFYQEATLRFAAVKDAWRNAVAHARGEYTDDEARKIYDMTRDLMQHLATRLRERKVRS